MWAKRSITILILLSLMTTSFLVIPPSEVEALSIDDYFIYTYNFTFSKTTVTGTETFYLTVNGQASCIQDMPLNASEAYIESRVVASLNGSQVVLNPNYTISYPDFPSKSGETASATMQVPLSFPSSCTGGVYDVTGYINIARIKVLGIWITVTGYLPASQPIGQITYQPPISGGGGSTTTSPVTNLTQFMDDNGIFLEDAQAQSIDKTVKLIFSKGTYFTVLEGIGSTVTIESVEEQEEPETPENCLLIGQSYNIRPEGANFSPPIKIQFSYDETSLPAGAQEKDLLIAWWDTESEKWVSLEDCEVDETANTITGFVEHFTMFALIINMSPPASFTISSLIVAPLQVQPGESVTVTVTVENTGSRTGIYTLILKINGVEEARKDIPLDSGTSTTVDFIVFRDAPGTYSIDINGLEGSIIVASSTTSEIEQTISPTESLSSSDTNQAPESQTGLQLEPSIDIEQEYEGKEQEQLPSDNISFVWWQVPVALAVGMVLGGFILLFLWRSRKTEYR